MITVLQTSQVRDPGTKAVLTAYLGDMPDIDIPQVYVEALKGYIQVWLIHNNVDLSAIFVTTVTEDAEGRTVQLVYLGGRCRRADFRAINNALSKMKEHTGADRIELRTKHNFGRAFRRFGWQQFGDTWWRV